jgi:hypothetical protein
MNPALTAVSRIHFLIHPMYIADPVRPEPLSEHEVNYFAVEARYLGLEYQSRARNAGPDELILAFSHLTRGELDRRSDPYAAFVCKYWRDFQDLIGPRLFLTYGEHDIFDNYKVGAQLQAEARRRGFRIHLGTESVGYGETLLTCVARASANLREAFDLRRRTTIELGLTDAAFWWDGAEEDGREYVRTYYRSLRLYLDESLRPSALEARSLLSPDPPKAARKKTPSSG